MWGMGENVLPVFDCRRFCYLGAAVGWIDKEAPCSPSCFQHSKNHLNPVGSRLEDILVKMCGGLRLPNPMSPYLLSMPPNPIEAVAPKSITNKFHDVTLDVHQSAFDAATRDTYRICYL